MWILNYVRRWAIRRLIGRMEVCKNITVVNGEIEYSGVSGGAICEDNSFVSRISVTAS